MEHVSKAELAYRRSGGIEVALWWDRPTGELTVCVADLRSGDSFEVRAFPDEALAAFYHPYAYASRGVYSSDDARTAA
jgi:hypothetical protein